MATYVPRSAESAAVALGVKAILVRNESPDEVRAVVHPTNGKIYVGSSAVTTTTGIPVISGATFSYTLAPREALYGIADTGTVDVRTLAGPGADLTGTA